MRVSLLLPVVAALAGSTHAALTATAVVNNIKQLTSKANSLVNPANRISVYNAPLLLTDGGPANVRPCSAVPFSPIIPSSQSHPPSVEPMIRSGSDNHFPLAQQEVVRGFYGMVQTAINGIAAVTAEPPITDANPQDRFQGADAAAIADAVRAFVTAHSRVLSVLASKAEAMGLSPGVGPIVRSAIGSVESVVDVSFSPPRLFLFFSPFLFACLAYGTPHLSSPLVIFLFSFLLCLSSFLVALLLFFLAYFPSSFILPYCFSTSAPATYLPPSPRWRHKSKAGGRGNR